MNDDAISRKDAINRIDWISSGMSVCATLDEANGMRRMKKQAILELTNMPSAQPTQTNAESNAESTQDCISRQAAILQLSHNKCGNDENDIAVQHDIETIRALPSAQTEIIRCRNCKWKQGAECVRFADVRPFPDDYCSRAERREG